MWHWVYYNYVPQKTETVINYNYNMYTENFKAQNFKIVPGEELNNMKLGAKAQKEPSLKVQIPVWHQIRRTSINQPCYIYICAELYPTSIGDTITSLQGENVAFFKTMLHEKSIMKCLHSDSL